MRNLSSLGFIIHRVNFLRTTHIRVSSIHNLRSKNIHRKFKHGLLFQNADNEVILFDALIRELTLLIPSRKFTKCNALHFQM